MSHKNILANFEQINAAFFGNYGGAAPPDTTVVSWLPFFHDMGLMSGNHLAGAGGNSRCAHQPGVIPAATGAVDAIAGKQQSRIHRSAERRLSNWPREKHQMTTWPGLTSAACYTILNGAERVQPATLQRFAERFARFNLHPKVLRPSYGLAEATVYVATSEARQPPDTVLFRIRGTDRRPREAVRERRRYTAGQLRRFRSRRWCASSTPRPVPSVRRERSVRSGCTATTSPAAIGRNRRRLNAPSAQRLSAPSAGTPEGPWLRTGDLGFFSDGELFIIGRIKDLLDRVRAQPLSR